MLKLRILALLIFSVILSSCSADPETTIQVAGRDLLRHDSRLDGDHSGIEVAVRGTNQRTSTDAAGMYDLGAISDGQAIIEHSKPGFGRKLSLTSEYAGGPVQHIILFPITPQIAATHEPRFVDTTYVTNERVGVVVENGDTISQGQLVERTFAKRLLKIPVTVDMKPGEPSQGFYSIDLYYSTQADIDVLDPKTYSWVETIRSEHPIPAGSTVEFVLDDQMFHYIAQSVAPPGSTMHARAFASPYYRPLNGQFHWHAPYYKDPSTNREVHSVYEGVTSNGGSFIVP